MTGTELDDILADNGSQGTEPTPSADTSVARDDHGRFAPKVEAQPVVDQGHPQNGETANAEAEHGNIPPAALAASRQKAREKEQEAEGLRSQLAAMQAQIELLSRQTTARQPAAPVEPEKKADFWEDPDGYLKGALTPVQQQLQQQAERFSMRMAIKDHGREVVQEAYSALGAAMQAGDPSARAEYQRIKASDDPYEDIVQWHKRHQTLQRVGDNPDAWLEAEIEKRLADPTHQGKFLERIQATAQQNSRSNPVTNLPPSLTRLPSGGNSTPGDMSDGSLFANALR